ncbi:hypothetical protein MPH_00107 [Macrophomina phaseolina MS6]|uniref:Uncharacterized protein n=1 Tax=Macrophomina phaseolina (strain MS6) TaxID=1126212 RepID=K2SJH5_MACPH|nr:hypothetical protein MPH_00107 [Macrophomina phaseolina MS6]
MFYRHLQSNIIYACQGPGKDSQLWIFSSALGVREAKDSTTSQRAGALARSPPLSLRSPAARTLGTRVPTARSAQRTDRSGKSGPEWCHCERRTIFATARYGSSCRILLSIGLRGK